MSVEDADSLLLLAMTQIRWVHISNYLIFHLTKTKKTMKKKGMKATDRDKN